MFKALLSVRRRHVGATVSSISLALLLSVSISVWPAACADEAPAAAPAAGAPAVAADNAWHTVSSKHGQFTVLLPGEVSKSKHESDNHESTNYFSSIKDGKPTDFLVSYTKYGSNYLSKRSKEKLLKDAMEMNVSILLGKIVKRKNLSWNSCQAIEFEFEGFGRSKKHAKAGKARDLRGKGRIILANDMEYALICTTTKPSLGAVCNQFFESFVLTH